MRKNKFFVSVFTTIHWEKPAWPAVVLMQSYASEEIGQLKTRTLQGLKLSKVSLLLRARIYLCHHFA